MSLILSYDQYFLTYVPKKFFVYISGLCLHFRGSMYPLSTIASFLLEQRSSGQQRLCIHGPCAILRAD